MLLKKIVVAEDDDAIAHMVNMALGDAGYLCLRARDGEEALRQVRMHSPDLLVLDIMMPRLDGHEVARHLKADVILSKTPILMLTALGDVDSKVKGFESGADDYLGKPFDLREFAARVKALIRQARRERERNPTTHLPGSSAIEDHVEQLLGEGKELAVVQFDVTRFDAYADRVGFSRAEALIGALGKIMLERARAAGNGSGFVGHLGGVDFVAVCPRERGEEVASQVIEGFEEHRRGLEGDEREAAGALSMVAAVVSTEGLEARSSDVLADRMAEALRQAKKREGSNYVVWKPEA